MNPYDDGIGLDEYIDWLIDAGYSIQTDRRLRRVVPAIRDHHPRPARAAAPGLATAAAAQLPATRETDPPEPLPPTDRFRSSVQEAKIGPDKDIPHVTAPIIVKYITNLPTARIAMRTPSPATKTMQIGVVSPLYELRGDPSATAMMNQLVGLRTTNSRC